MSPTNALLRPVPEPEQRELPIPQPGSTAQRTIALVEPIVSSDAGAKSARPLHARNFDPDVPSTDAPRSPKIIPAVDFIETLFEKANAEGDATAVTAKDTEKAGGKKARKAAAKTPTAAEIEHQLYRRRSPIPHRLPQSRPPFCRWLS